MSNYKYNNEGDFLTWYKNAYGKDYTGGKFERPKGMDGPSWAAVQELYKGYQGDLPRQKYINDITNRYSNDTNAILQKYASDKNALDETKRTAQQNASITYDKLKKYLPSQIKVQGLSGTGASESAMLEADTHYMNSMGDISATHSKNLTDLNNSRNETVAELERYKNQEISDINREYDGYLRDAGEDALGAYATKENEIKQEKDRVLESTVLPRLDELEAAGNWNEANNYLIENKDYFTNEYEYNAKMSQYKEKINKMEDSKQLNEAVKVSDLDGWYENDTVKIDMNGKGYVFEGGKKVGSEMNKKLNELTTADGGTEPAYGTIAIYNENLYICTHEGWRKMRKDEDSDQIYTIRTTKRADGTLENRQVVTHENTDISTFIADYNKLLQDKTKQE